MFTERHIVYWGLRTTTTSRHLKELTEKSSGVTHCPRFCNEVDTMHYYWYQSPDPLMLKLRTQHQPLSATPADFLPQCWPLDPWMAGGTHTRPLRTMYRQVGIRPISTMYRRVGIRPIRTMYRQVGIRPIRTMYKQAGGMYMSQQAFLGDQHKSSYFPLVYRESLLLSIFFHCDVYMIDNESFWKEGSLSLSFFFFFFTLSI